MSVATSCNDPPEEGDHRQEENGRPDPWAIEASPDGLIDSPLDFIFAEHHRQREAALILIMLADGEFNKRGIASLIEFLETDFVLHIGDEELALFPLMKEWCLPEDNVERVIERLRAEHREDETVGEAVIAILKSLGDENTLKQTERVRLRSFADHILQHLALENGVLLPIARVRFQQAELKTLADMLKDRRR